MIINFFVIIFVDFVLYFVSTVVIIIKGIIILGIFIGRNRFSTQLNVFYTIFNVGI